MILTGKMYTFQDNYLYLEIDKNWFIKNVLKDLYLCGDCIKKNKDNCLFLYSCRFKYFHCTQLSFCYEIKLIEKLDNIK
ncbi:hypothetical protein M0R19_03755 [Candidatus Pacearchaeota archaeon]|jgi:hypothetical protein|nr:hypothetical protein [Candidatus Pacearchaeota archaeon]